MPHWPKVLCRDVKSCLFLLTYTILLSMHISGLGAAGIETNDINLPGEEDQPTFLTNLDFLNARFIDTNRLQASRRPDALRNDQRFPVKRFRRGSVVALESDKWPTGRIPYVLSSAYTSVQRAVLARAIGAYNAKTCIRFVPKSPSDKDFVVISKLDGCYADFARVGGRQQVSLADECIDYATVIHEFMHVIGFIHEHQREDRDGFVRILSAVGLSNYGETYDYFSIMHYESSEGSRNGRSTIEAKVNEYTPLMGKSTDFTRGDLNRINRAYQCAAYLTG
ncbi:astacin (Peptidase family m12A) domain-containing protein [Ditylenchus destructor]|nr:astacin (Peptidase family m12A) domain-containing protein [Ditylenchus destructor]